jgi:N4-gp56 family major capsid protein
MADQWTSVGGTYALTDAIRTVYSSLIMLSAQPVMRFSQFAEIRQELGVSPGLTIQFLKYANLSDASDLTEETDMTVESLVSSTVSVTVTEKGHAVGITEKLLQSAFTDVMADASQMLGINYARKEDTDLRDVVLGVTNTEYGYNGTSAATARAEITSDHVFTTSLVKDGAEVLASSDVPKVGGEFWVCFIHPHQARKLRDDTYWRSANEYAGSRAIFLGECGMYEDTIFIETTQIPTLTGSGSGGANVYRGVMFGDMLYALAISLPVELRDNGVQDFGRKHSLAWYSIFGSGLLNSTYGCVLETA